MAALEKVALVTGSSRGIGKAIAATLAKRGAVVALTYNHDRAAAEQTVAEIAHDGRSARIYRAAVEDAASVTALVRDVVRDHGRIDILINNAGLSAARRLGEIDSEFVARMFNVNVWGTIQVTQAAVPHFGESGGRIVNLSSQRIFQPKDGLGVYAASKAAVSVLTKAFAEELGPKGITVNAVAPAVTHTDMTAKMPPEKKAAFAAATPLRRLAEPQDIADVVAFLASDEARWITGRTLLADGGLT